MKITKELLEESFRNLAKEFSLDKDMSDDEYDILLSGANLFKLELECILDAKSEEDLKIAQEEANKFMEIFHNDKLTFKEKEELWKKLGIY